MVDCFRGDLNFFKKIESILSELVEGMRIVGLSDEFNHIVYGTHERLLILEQIADNLLRDGFLQGGEFFFRFQKPTIIPIPLDDIAHTDQGLMPHADVLG